jgi:hypothetical protein
MSHETAVMRLKVTLGESAVAALAATASATLFEVPVWAMFVGWIAYFTRGLTLRQGAINFACVLVGIAVGLAAGATMQGLTPQLGVFTLPAVVFAVAAVVLSLRHLPVLNNLLCFFLGLVAYFASHLAPGWTAFAELGIATGIGTAAAYLASLLHQQVHRAASPGAP